MKPKALDSKIKNGVKLSDNLEVMDWRGHMSQGGHGNCREAENGVSFLLITF
jgi:hypothetical protein